MGRANKPDHEQFLKATEAEIASLVGTINVATARLVGCVAEVIDSGGSVGVGYRSVGHWLSVHAGLSQGRAQGIVAIAERLDELPTTAAKFATGSLSEDQVRPIARRVPGEYEESVAEVATELTPSQVARTVLRYRFTDRNTDTGTNDDTDDSDRPDNDEPDDTDGRENDARRRVGFGHNDNGSWWARIDDLPAHDGALVQKALEGARDEIFNERRGAGDDRPDAPIGWADALVRMAEHALAHMGDGKGSQTRDRLQLNIHVRGEDLDTNPDPLAWLHLGPSIPRTVLMYLSCDADVRVILERDGTVVNVGRKHHIVTDKVRRMIEDRDQGCRYPGCNNQRWLDVHHICHWAKGGLTDTHNLCCFCKHHHRMHHRGEFTVAGNADQPHGLVFKDKWGKLIPTGPKPSPPHGPPDPGTWKRPSGAHLDPWAVTFNKKKKRAA